MRVCFGLFFLACILLNGCSNEELSSKFLKTSELSVNELDTLNLDGCTIHDLILLAGQASALVGDTLNGSHIKGYVLLGAVSDYLTTSEDGDLLKDEKAKEYLIFILGKLGCYFPNPPSDLEKAWHYLKEGEILYIWSRIRGRNYHYAIVLFCILVVVGVLYWKKTR